MALCTVNLIAGGRAHLLLLLPLLTLKPLARPTRLQRDIHSTHSMSDVTGEFCAWLAPNLNRIMGPNLHLAGLATCSRLAVNNDTTTRTLLVQKLVAKLNHTCMKYSPVPEDRIFRFSQDEPERTRLVRELFVRLLD